MNLRTDMYIDTNKEYKLIKKYNNIEILESIYKTNIYHTIKFDNINNKSLNNIFLKEILYFINKLNINIKHVLIVGLGNINNTADSIGPITINKIKVNYNIKGLDNINNIKVSAFIPGILSSTGINTDKIIKCISNLIKPDLVILIDSFITNNINYINQTIEISNTGIKPGSGILNFNKLIDYNLLKKPIITIGIPVSLEYINNNKTMLLTNSNIDLYVAHITDLISNTLNTIFNRYF